ncbi:DUF6193 family natural product biosynthesis protein [Kitasatospora sp. NPDC048545]|uniref:DUF6193 family natural product biosynthesis protein n=1 Tax=Kitasatospora sp. NPDC048545 TaxID=3157208 RepID=UPI0033EA08CC
MRSDGQNELPPKPAMPDIAAARAIGPDAAVEARWQTVIPRWESTARTHGRGPGSECVDLVRLLRAAYAEPRLRWLYPWTSHYTLRFSRSTTSPWADEGIPFVEPMGGGVYRVHHPSGHDPLGSPAGPEAAVALVVEHLPPDLGPVVNRPEEKGNRAGAGQGATGG